MGYIKSGMTDNFVTFSEPVVTKDRYTNIEEQIKDCASTAFGFDAVDYAERGVSVPVSEEIAMTLIKNNITVEYESTEIPETVTVNSREELEKVTAKIKYTDGSVHEKRVNWEADTTEALFDVRIFVVIES